MQAADFDPSPFTNWLTLISVSIGLVILISGVIVRVNRQFEKRVTELIKNKTKPIQAETNGGLSLTDLHTKFDAMDEKVDRLERHYDHIIETEELAREVWHNRYTADQSRIRKEWTAVFVAIRKMIHLPPEDQVVIWDGITKQYIDGTIVDKHPDERKDK